MWSIWPETHKLIQIWCFLAKIGFHQILAFLAKFVPICVFLANFEIWPIFKLWWIPTNWYQTWPNSNKLIAKIFIQFLMIPLDFSPRILYNFNVGRWISWFWCGLSTLAILANSSNFGENQQIDELLNGNRYRIRRSTLCIMKERRIWRITSYQNQNK